MTRFNARRHAGQAYGQHTLAERTDTNHGRVNAQIGRRQQTMRHGTLRPGTLRLGALRMSGLALLSSASFLALSSLDGAGTAHANCIGTTGPDANGYFGTNAPDTVTCDNQPPPDGTGSILTFGGADTITIEGGTFVGVQPGEGDDTITVTGGSISSGILDADNASSGEDTFDLSGGSIAVVSGADDDDVYNISGSVVLGGIDEGSGRTGNDTVNMSGGTVGETINAGLGMDVITLTGGTVGDGIIGSGMGDVRGGADSDTITLNGTFVTDDINGGGGSDFIDILSGTADDVFGDSGLDGGADTIRLLGGFVNDDVRSLVGDDLVVLDGATVGDDIRGGDGQDRLTLLSGTVTDVYGDNNEAGLGGDDVITLNGATVTNDIEGDAGNDMIALLSGSVDDVRGDEGADQITLDGAIVADDILGGIGRDTISLTSGTVGPGFANDDADVFGGDGDDLITLAGAFVSDDIDGDGGDDIVTLAGGTVADSVFGDGGNDLIALAGAQVGIEGGSGDLVGNANDDTITWSSGDLTGGIFGDNRNTGGELASDRVLITDPAALLSGRVLEGDSGDGGNVNAADGKIDVLRLDGWTGDLTGATITNWEIMQIAGGTATFVDAGLTVGSDTDAAGLFIESDGAVAVTQSFDLVGNLGNGGLVDLTTDGGATDTVFSVSGDYAADGDIALDAVLDDGGDLDDADVLRVDGDTSGATTVFVTNQGGLGAETGDGDTDGILVVAVGGDSDGAFVLGEEVLAGIFEYELRQADGQNWYLQSAFLDQAFPYESLPGALQAIGQATVGQLVERVGVRSALATAGDGVVGSQPVTSGVWARAVGLSLESDGNIDSTTGATFDQTIGFLQGGAEVEALRRDSGRLLVGIMGHWGNSSLDVSDAANAARGGADIDLFGGGINVTWYGTSGLYFDNVFQYTGYDVDFSTTSRWSSATTDGHGIALSHEAGYRLPISDDFTIVPQAQIIWQSIDFDDFTDPDGVRVSLNDGDSLVGRLGVAMEGNQLIGSALVTGYAEANLLHEFLGDNEVQAAATPLRQDLSGTSAEVGLGGTVAVTDGVSVYAEIDYTLPFDGGVRGVQASGGVRVAW